LSCISTNNYAGCIYISHSDIVLNNLEIKENQGSGIEVKYSNPELKNLVILENNSSRGAGIFLRNSNSLLSNIHISNNTSTYEGGGLNLSRSNPILQNVKIIENYSLLRDGGGIFLWESSPIIYHSKISKNTSARYGGGVYLGNSSPKFYSLDINGNSSPYGSAIYSVYESEEELYNVSIFGNEGSSKTYFIKGSNPLLQHVTIYKNSGVAIWNQNYSSITIKNSIIWDHSSSINQSNSNYPNISYSNIEGISDSNYDTGDGNIDLDPLFSDSNPLETGDFSLHYQSPCINSGGDLGIGFWSYDIDGTIPDIGVTGGLHIIPNFISFDFGDVGDIGSSINFKLFNYRDIPIIIDNVDFGSSSFSTSTIFPLIIDPIQTKTITIDANNFSYTEISDSMILQSKTLPNGINIELSSNGIVGNTLIGNISGYYPSANYRIVGDIIIPVNEVVIIEEGTKFLFDGLFSFKINGTINAFGQMTDSIMFVNFEIDQTWEGIVLESSSDESILQYVKIIGVDSTFSALRFNNSNATLSNASVINNHGIGIEVSNSNPIISFSEISNNTAGGISIDYSKSPLIKNSLISNNNGFIGGLRLWHSHPSIINTIISENSSEGYGSIYLVLSNPILSDVSIINNFCNGIAILANSNPYLKNVEISNNVGMGLYLSDDYNQSAPIFKNVIINDNITDIDIYLFQGNPTFINCTIIGNSSDKMIYIINSYPRLINSILWGSTFNQIEFSSNHGFEETIKIYNSNFNFSQFSDWEGDGNINSNPFFIDPNEGNYFLQSNSSCIDAGTAFFEWEDEVIVDMSPDDYYGTAPDMGAYEYIPEFMPGDVTEDGLINVLDVVMLVNIVLNGSEYNNAGDLNNDSLNNVLDVVALVQIILNG